MDNKYLEFKSLEALSNLQSRVNNFQVGEIVYIIDKEKFVMWDGINWIDVPKNTSVNTDGLSMTMYELNKGIISQLPLITDFESCRQEVMEFKRKNQGKSYMLLCREISYYTIFQPDGNGDFGSFGEAVITCAKDVGNLVSVDHIDGNMVEIWVRTPEDDNLCMYLFNCEDFIVTYGG